MNQLAKFLTGVAVGEPQTHGNLTIYPLRRPNGHQRSYLTLDEALKANVVVVKEVSEGGSVPTLVVHNTGSLPVLIVVGEELVGAKQTACCHAAHPGGDGVGNPGKLRGAGALDLQQPHLFHQRHGGSSQFTPDADRERHAQLEDEREL
jgi:hypothetical protein